MINHENRFNNPILQEDLNRILECVKTDFSEMRGKRIFISGGTGFFGFWLLESFCQINRMLKIDSEAIVLTRNPERFATKWPHLAKDPAIHLLKGDIRNFSFPEGECELGIHAATAASDTLSSEDQLEMYSTILDGTKRFLEFAAKAKMEKLLFISSGAVYGLQPPEMTHILEDYLGAPDQISPKSCYAEGKRAAEQMCVLYAKKFSFDVKIARCFAFVGPELPLDAHYAIGNFINNGLRNEDYLIKGDGTPFRSYLYAADLTIWLWTILFRGESGRPYNVGSDERHTILEVAELVSKAFPNPSKIIVRDRPIPGAQLKQYVPGVGRCKSELSLKETISLEQAITRTKDYYHCISKF